MLKIWRFYESRKNHERVKSSPIALFNLDEEAFRFSADEGYLAMLLYKSGNDRKCPNADSVEPHDLSNFPAALWNVVQSSENLSPRGLGTSFASNVDDIEAHSIDSILRSRRGDVDSARTPANNSGRDTQPKGKKRGSQHMSGNGKDKISSQASQANSGGSDGAQAYRFILFVWSGKNASAPVKALTLTKAYALDEYLKHAQDAGLNVLFSGGVIRNKKLQRGSIFMFEDVVEKAGANISQPQTPYKRVGDDPTAYGCTPEGLLRAQDAIYLMKWLYSEAGAKVFKPDAKKGRFPRFHESFLSAGADVSTTSGESTKRSGEQPKGKTVQPMQQAKKKQGSGRQAQASGSARGNVTLAQAYWDRFESIDELDELELDEDLSDGTFAGAKDFKAAENVPKLAMPAPM